MNENLIFPVCPNALMRSSLAGILAGASPAVADLGSIVRDESGLVSEQSIVMTDTKAAIRKLVGEAYEDGKVPGWDGYDALPVSYDALRSAMRFGDALAIGRTVLPEVVPEADGCIEFDWRIDDDNLLSVSVDGNNQVSYVGISDGKEYSGKYCFDLCSTFPERLMNGLAQFSI